ncbi:hypothetical protein AB0E08_36395 [Streptomyces sp. NPDC048281]|uniref:hypothetical protein n=1 Tax=Streptomyces sp. NPDC048281 TaxID=3154715 RepID=UPI00341CC4B7
MTPAARWARAEWGLLYATVRGPLTKRRLRAVPLTVGAVCLTALLQFTQNQSWGYRLVQNAGAVRAADPLWAALLRTPLSLFVPALDLPVWGALVQVLVVLGIAEVCLGWYRTLVVAYVATLAGTLYARTGIALGPHGPLGLPASDALVVDTGPSAAVVGLAVYLGWRYGAYVTAGAVVAAMAVEVALKDNLAGKEHLAAIAGVALLCAVVPAGRRLWRRWRHRRPGSGPGLGPGPGPGLRPGSSSGSGRSGLPPIQS